MKMQSKAPTQDEKSFFQRRRILHLGFEHMYRKSFKRLLSNRLCLDLKFSLELLRVPLCLYVEFPSCLLWTRIERRTEQNATATICMTCIYALANSI